MLVWLVGRGVFVTQMSRVVVDEILAKTPATAGPARAREIAAIFACMVKGGSVTVVLAACGLMEGCNDLMK